MYKYENTSKRLPARKLKASLSPVPNIALYKNLLLSHGTRNNNWPILNFRMTAHLLIATRFLVYHSVSIRVSCFWRSILPDDWERLLNVRETASSKATCVMPLASTSLLTAKSSSFCTVKNNLYERKFVQA